MKLEKESFPSLLVIIAMICLLVFFASRLSPKFSPEITQQLTTDSLKYQSSQINEESLKKNKLKKDSIEADHIQKLGEATLISIDKESKCNLTKGMYILNKVIIDSSDLAFIVNNLSLSLFKSTHKNESCPWPVMSAAYLYMNQKGFDNNEVIAGCTISPPDYMPYVFVNMWQVSNYKK